MKRQKMTQLATALVVVAAGVAIAGTVAAQAGPVAKGAPDPSPQVAAGPARAQAGGARQGSCPTAGTICAFSGPDATGSEFSFPTMQNHSKWIPFDKAIDPSGAPFNPDSIINNSGSDIWVEDASAGLTGGPYCALGTTLTPYTFTGFWPVNGGTTPPPSPPSPGYTPTPYQPGFFFINYNVNTCAGPVATPTPTPAG